MTVLSDELVELATLHAYAADPGVSYVSAEAVRAAIEGVLPDIERPWQEKVETLEILFSDTREELNLKDEAIAVLSEGRDTQHFQLVERDKEIKELKADLFLANVPLVRIDEFSDAEREAVVLALRHCLGESIGVSLMEINPLWRSVRARLEQGQ